nr:alpha/beta fold hydrolase [Allomuricauda sp.]
MRKFRLFGISLILIALLSFIMIRFFQEKLIFLPTQLPLDFEYAFESDFNEFFLETKDGARLNALHFTVEQPKGLILYFHGNAGDLSRWGMITSDFTQFGYDVIVMDYRGYGKSSGKISEQALFSDAQLFYEYALKRYAEESIIVYGRSLGASVATHLTSQNNPKKLMLETPFYNLADVAKERFPLLPINQLLRYKLESNEYIQNVGAPIRIFHGTADRVVDYESGKRLFEVIPSNNKKMYTIDDGGHNNLASFDLYWEGIQLELLN